MFGTIGLIGGAVAGWLAGRMVNSRHGLLMNIILGLIGSVVGGWLFGLVGLTTSSWFGDVLVAAVGAALLLLIFGRSRQ